MKEEDMYPIVEEYLKNKIKNIGFEINIFSGNASSVDLSLPLFGSHIKPDVYAVGEDKNGVFRIIMAEGKLTYKGRDLDGVIWQAMSDQRFSHFVYIFFPVNELKDAKEALESASRVIKLIKDFAKGEFGVEFQEGVTHL